MTPLHIRTTDRVTVSDFVDEIHIHENPSRRGYEIMLHRTVRRLVARANDIQQRDPESPRSRLFRLMNMDTDKETAC